MRETVIEYAERRYRECCAAGDYEVARYWSAYLLGAKRQKKEDEEKER